MRAAERIASGWGALLRVLRARMLPQVATPFDARIALTLCRCRPLMPAPACTSWAHCPPLGRPFSAAGACKAAIRCCCSFGLSSV